MPDSDDYMIKLHDTGDCLFPDSENNLISGACSNSNNQIYTLRKISDTYLEGNLPDILKVSIGFSDNRTAYVENSNRNWGKIVSVETHNYVSEETKRNADLFHLIKDPELYRDGVKINNPKIKDFLTEIYSLHPGDIYNVDLQQSKSVFNSKIHHKDLIIEGIKSLDFNGKKILVSITNNRGQKDESSFSHRDHKKKRKSRKKYY